MFEKIKKYYEIGVWTEQRVRDAVAKGILDGEQFKEITGKGLLDNE
ncbi:MAG: XkdX family protein [Synergistaceae bacterium]|nr:XkdX family protein [Synergistaceae bacterium]MBR0169154.1 XkdX family protein [Synergistaceae bacterium]